MRRRQPELWLLAVVLGVGLPAVMLFHFYGPQPVATPLAKPTTPSLGTVALQVSDEPAVPAVWLDVHSPSALRAAARKNAWFQETLKAPIGQGFLGTWAGFLGTRGKDVALNFEGSVADVLVDQVFDAPFRITWFSGKNGTSTPAVILPTLSASAKTALAVLGGAGNGSYTATDCPGEQVLENGPIQIDRWLLADHAVYAFQDASDRLYLARHPLAVLHAVCQPGAAISSQGGVDVELHFSATQLGREVHTLASALGLGSEVTLSLGLDGDRLVARGVGGAVLVPGRLGKESLRDDALKLLPADTSLVMSLQIALPEQLTSESLQSFWKGGFKGAVKRRAVTLAWQPRGDGNLPDEWALIWGEQGELPALETLFSQADFASSTVCAQAVIASNDTMLQRLRKTCGGNGPNLLHAAPPVAAGLRVPASIVVGVNLGSLLPQLMMDGFYSENGSGMGAAPAEIQEAKRQLQSLPFLGFRGTAEGNVLVPGGFGS